MESGGGGSSEQQREERVRKRDDRVELGWWWGGVKWEVGQEVTGRQNGTLRRRRKTAHSSWKTGFRAQTVARRKSGQGERGGRRDDVALHSQSSASCWIAGANLTV